MGNVKATKTVTNKTYAVAGDTLQEIEDSLFANQLSGSTDAVGDCKTGVKTPAISKFIEKEEAKPKKKGTVEYTVTAKAGPKVELNATITLPALRSSKKLSAKAKKEWERFLAKLTAHEQQHFADVWKVTEDIAKELSELTGRGAGKTKDAAIKAAKADFKAQSDKKYSSAAVTKRIQKAHDDLDKKGNTFVLNLDID